MKKITAALMLLLLLLFLPTSCAPKASDPLAYQSMPARVTAGLTTPDGEFSLDITLTGGSGADEIRLTSPETVSGMTVKRQGDAVVISSGDVSLPVSEAAAEGWIALFGLFSLDKVAISSIEEKDGVVTVGVGSAPSRVFVSFEGGENVPTSIKTEDGALALEISEFEFADSVTEGDQIK